MTKVKYKVKERINHLIVDGKRLGPGEVFEQTEEYYERNKIYVDPVFPARKLEEAKVDEPMKKPDNPSKSEKEEEPKPVPSEGRVVRKRN